MLRPSNANRSAMKRFYKTLDTWQDRLDGHWRQLTPVRRRKIVLYSFAAYLIITIAIVLQVICEMGAGHKEIDITHIGKPTLQAAGKNNSTRIIQELKNENNERE